MSDGRHYRRTEGAAAGRVDGQTVVVSPADLRYHALNTTAAAVWESLADGTDLDQAVECLMARFEVDASTCRRDVEACLQHFMSIGIAAPSDE